MHVSRQRANNLLGTLFPKIINLCSSLIVEERVSRLHKTIRMFQSLDFVLIMGRLYCELNGKTHSSKSLCSQHFCKSVSYDVFLARRQPQSWSTLSVKSRMEQRFIASFYIVVCDTAIRHKRHLFETITTTSGHNLYLSSFNRLHV
jgi:hypothetical protein